MRPGTKAVIGVGGNIGTGKTTVSKMFAELGARYVSADEIGWEVLPEIVEELEAEFGKAIVSGRKVNKEKLREVVFTDGEKLRFLNRTSHPLLTRRIIGQVEAIRSGKVVIDAALLFDWPEVYDIVDYPILVRSKRELMLSRAKAKGISEKLFESIVSLQRNDEEVLGMASYVIENNGTMSELRTRCQLIYEEISHDC